MLSSTRPAQANAMQLELDSRIRRITVDELEPGMFVHDLNCGWLDHPFLFNRFLVNDTRQIEKIRAHGIRELYIDPTRGRDVPNAPTAAEVNTEFKRRIRTLADIKHELAASRAVSIEEERPRADNLHKRALGSMRDFFGHLRYGAPAGLELLEPTVEQLVGSVRRQPDALIPMTRDKSADDYACEHSVASAALMTAFGARLELPPEVLRDLALGALLQDVGMVTIPEHLLGKSGRLTEVEYALVTAHVHRGSELLDDVAALPLASREVIIHHHERLDGSGYPKRLTGDAISLHGQMAAIVDVYDALISQRPHHAALIPTLALQKLYEWSAHHFSRQLVLQFIRTVGIYPVGSLVRMKSGYLGVVVAQHESELLRPRVRLFFNPEKNLYIRPYTIRVGFAAGAAHGPIASAESWNRWKLDPARS